MKYADVEDSLLLSAYSENRDDPNFRMTLDVLLERHPIDAPQPWIQQALKSLSDRSLIHASNSSAPNRRVRLTGDGLRKAEELLEQGLAAVETSGRQGATVPGAEEFEAARYRVEVPGEGLVSISSARWTGIENRLNSRPEIVNQISLKIQEIDDLIPKSGLTNHEQVKAKAITEGLRALVSSPEPEWETIVRLLTAPALTAALNVAQIIQLTMILIFG